MDVPIGMIRIFEKLKKSLQEAAISKQVNSKENDARIFPCFTIHPHSQNQLHNLK